MGPPSQLCVHYPFRAPAVIVWCSRPIMGMGPHFPSRVHYPLCAPAVTLWCSRPIMAVRLWFQRTLADLWEPWIGTSILEHYVHVHNIFEHICVWLPDGVRKGSPTNSQPLVSIPL